MLSAVGDTLVESAPTLRVYGGFGTIRDSELRQAIKIGSEWTFEQHFGRGVALGVAQPTEAVGRHDCKVLPRKSKNDSKHPLSTGWG